MHSEKRKEALHEPTRQSNRSLSWESGAEDARTPDASRLPGVSEPREASGVRPIYPQLYLKIFVLDIYAVSMQSVRSDRGRED